MRYDFVRDEQQNAYIKLYIFYTFFSYSIEKIALLVMPP